MKAQFLLKVLTILVIVFSASSCRKDKVKLFEDPREKYFGTWNFKGNSFSYSGYYDYSGDPADGPVWTSTTTTSTNYNDSTGSVKAGDNLNEVIIKFCSYCQEEVDKLDESGTGAWGINEFQFYNNINPGPPGYSPSYSTYNVEGWKID